MTEPAMTRYIICPGWIRSKSDGDAHYIGYRQLIRLYAVNPRLCLNAEFIHGYQISPEDIHLHPKFDGDYSLP